jgi:hypothetical protein
MLALIGQLFQ